MSHSALTLAHGLSLQQDESALCQWWLTSLLDHYQPSGGMLAMLDISGRKLLCQGRVLGQVNELVLSVDDLSHPLAYVLQKGEYRIWDSLHGDARIEHVELRAFLANLGQRCGMLVMPLLSSTGQPFALLALMDRSIKLQEWLVATELMTWCQLFANQLSLLRQLVCNQRESTVLRDLRHHTKGVQKKKEQDLAEHLVGSSVAISRLRRQIYQASSHRLSLLIQGETGCGKEVVARLVHQNSDRAGQPWVAINCAAIPENLIESELFGYQKGAFSGAVASKRGLVAQAHGGTLFLDEVGDMPLLMQAKLLRVLETRHYRPLGGDRECYSDFRLVAATHRPLNQWVEEGRFRADLYHRLGQSFLFIPPLRERLEDLGVLCQHFIAQFAKQDGKQYGSLHRDFINQLMSYDFPGNVRELRNLLEVACAHTPDGAELSLSAIPDEFSARLCVGASAKQDSHIHIQDLRKALHSFEASVISARLRHFQGNRRLVAQSLNIPKRTLDHKCQKLEVS